MEPLSSFEADKHISALILPKVNLKLENYLNQLMLPFSHKKTEKVPSHNDSKNDDVSNAIFELLTCRRYCYISRKRSRLYRNNIVSLLNQYIDKNVPVEFFYDIGGGYRASLRPGQEDLIFNVGIAELFVLHQLTSFCNEISIIYPPGAHFRLVIDNLCAFFANDIHLQNTTQYIEQLRQLIIQTELGNQVQLLVESELIAITEYQAKYQCIKAENSRDELSAAEHDIVNRFLGRQCKEEEAIKRIEQYQRSTSTTECLLAPYIKGVRLTQRATLQTLCFRSFPGGDQRIQAGDIALSYGAGGEIRPILLTSRNIDHYELLRVTPPSFLPAAIAEVVYVQPKDDS